MNSLLLSIILIAFGHNYCDKTATDTSSEKMTIPIEYSFNSIVIHNNLLVFITEGDKNEIIVRNEEVANRITYKVADGVLVIRGKKYLFKGSNQVRIIITVKNLNCITVMDDAEVRTIGELSYRNLRLEIYGDGVMYVTTKANTVNTFIKGLGKIEVKGNFKNTTVNKDAYGNMVTIYD